MFGVVRVLRREKVSAEIFELGEHEDAYRSICNQLGALAVKGLQALV